TARLAQEAGRYDLVGVDIGIGDRRRNCVELSEFFHPHAPARSLRTSVRRPVTAAAAAMAGLTRWVRAPLPWRPAKLRFDVEAQRCPAATVSPFTPTHIEHPA